MEKEQIQNDSIVLGRDGEIKYLLENIKKRRHVLLTGHIGTGKSALLQEIYKRIDAEKKYIVYIKEANPLKDCMIELCYKMHHKYKHLRMYEIPDEEIVNSEWKDIKRKVSRLKNKDLAGIILKSVNTKDYTIILDHLERITPTAKTIIEVLMDKACVIGGYSGQPKDDQNLRKLWMRFVNIRLNNLDAKEAIRLIDYYFDTYCIFSEDRQMFKKKILKYSRGNPLAIKEMCWSGSLENYVKRPQVREIQHEAGMRYFDMTPLVILFLFAFVGLRFFALGTNDTDTYVFAGWMTVFGLFVRFVLFRYAK